MAKTTLRRTACWTVLGILALALAVPMQPGVSAEDNTPEKTPVKKVKKEQTKKGFHRLPPGYADVVDDEQRQKIYDIQDEYGPRIKELREKLRSLLKERNEKISEVLTDEQQQQIDAARAEAKAKRKARRERKKQDD